MRAQALENPQPVVPGEVEDSQLGHGSPSLWMQSHAHLWSRQDKEAWIKDKYVEKPQSYSVVQSSQAPFDMGAD